MSEKPLPAYLVAKLHVKDHADYLQRYGMPVIAQLQKVGAEVVATSAKPRVLEGEWDANWTVVIRFPSMAVAEEWWASEDYQPLKSLRRDELTNAGTAIFVEGFDPAALGL